MNIPMNQIDHENIHHHVVINPASGGGAGTRIRTLLPRLFEKYGLGADFSVSLNPPHFRSLVKKFGVRENARTVICGGDGSVNMALNELLPNRILRLGLIPCGRGNDFARTLGISRAAERAVKLLTRGRERPIDVGFVGKRPFATIAAAGYDADVSVTASKIKRIKGGLVYLFAALKEFVRLKPRTVIIEGDEFSFEGPALMVSFANAPFYGGGMQLSPDSRVDDGKIEICLLRNMSKLEFLMTMPGIYSGRHVRSPKFICGSSSRIRVSSPDGGPITADGELIGTLPEEISVRPSCIRVISNPLHM